MTVSCDGTVAHQIFSKRFANFFEEIWVAAIGQDAGWNRRLRREYLEKGKWVNVRYLV